MSQNTLNFPPLDDLDKKMKETFQNRIVRKGYSDTIQALKSLPRYISEYLISLHADENGILPQDAIKEITDDLIKYRPDMREKEAFKARAMELRSVEVIDHYEVITDLKAGKYRTKITSIDEKATVDKELVKANRFPGMLRGGLWGKAKFNYMQKGDGAHFNMCDFESFQTPSAVLRKYIEARKQFTTDEWINVLIRTAGLNPVKYTREERLLYLCRLIPFVEEGTNIFEMGPSASGKSFLYENLSHYSRMILGGDTTPAKLIYNQSTRSNGLIFNYDVICFDEINKKTSSMTELISKLQQIMASNRVERGDIDVQTMVSLVYQGNIREFQTNKQGIKVPRMQNHFEDIPKGMQDYAFLDRIHGYIPGWKLPQVSPESVNRNLGLICNYFGQILHSLRREDYSAEIDEKIWFFRLKNADGDKVPVTIRDKRAITHILEGYLKLIFPHREITNEELMEITNIAVELRQSIVNEIKKIESNLFDYKLGYTPIKMEKLRPEIAQDLPAKESIETLPAGDSTKTPDYQQNALYITDKGLLTRSLPYWLIKLLVKQDLLTIKENNYCLSTKDKIPVDIITEKANPLTGTITNPIDYQVEEEKLEILRKALQELNDTQDKYLILFQKIQIIKTQIDTSKDVAGSLALLKEIEDLEKEVVKSGLSWSQAKLKTECIKISKEIKLMDQIRGIDVDIIGLEKAPIFRPADETIHKIQGDVQKWQSTLTEISGKFEPVLAKSAQFISKTPIKQVEVLFNGQKFPFYSFDMNNLHYSFRDKFPNIIMRATNPIRRDFLPKKGPYKAFYFASKQLEGYQKDIPNDEYNRWFIEPNFKFDDYGQKKYCDVDALLTAQTHTFLEKYHHQIERFVLGSGDKDLHIVCDKAKEYKIPIEIVVVDEKKNLSLELRRLATNIYEL